MNWSKETVERVAQNIANALAENYPEWVDPEVTSFDKVCAKAALAAVAECDEVKALVEALGTASRFYKRKSRPPLPEYLVKALAPFAEDSNG